MDAADDVDNIYDVHNAGDTDFDQVCEVDVNG